MATDSEFVFSSLKELIKHHAPDADISGIDDIVVSYVIGVVEDAVAGEPVDVESVKELVTAYAPSFCQVPDQQLDQWVTATVLAVKEQKDKGKTSRCVSLDAIVSSFSHDTKLTVAPPPVQDEVQAALQPQPKEVSGKQRKCSSSSTSTSSSVSSSSDLDTLMEMFPDMCRVDAERCLLTCGGDVQEAICLMLDTPTPATRIMAPIDSGIGKHGSGKVVDDKTVKASIINKYSFVDNDEDRKEHRPLMPKWEGKKMVRYRDNKVVSLKGERYTEIKKEEPEDLKKTYVNLKPGRQYRFH